MDGILAETADMTARGGLPFSGIDCDVHPSVGKLSALVPYLSDHWAAQVEARGLNELDSNNYPLEAPLTARADWRPARGKPATTPEILAGQALVPFGTRTAILNCLYSVQLPYSEDMGAGFARALNDWIRAEWLDRDPRLRASIVIPMQSPALAAEEIERCAGDRRFVQVMMLVMGEMPLGRRYHWPIYEAAARHGLPIGIHPGSMYRYPIMGNGYGSSFTEDYATQATAFQTQLTSLIVEGVFSKFPELMVVMLESGFTWLPAYLWRLDKYWQGLRMEIPWVKRSPGDIVRSNVRFTITPCDRPPTDAQFSRLLEHLGCDDLLLFSTDYPHWQFEGTDVLPSGLSLELTRKIMVDNPLSVYSRIAETIP